MKCVKKTTTLKKIELRKQYDVTELMKKSVKERRILIKSSLKKTKIIQKKFGKAYGL